MTRSPYWKLEWWTRILPSSERINSCLRQYIPFSIFYTTWWAHKSCFLHIDIVPHLVATIMLMAMAIKMTIFLIMIMMFAINVILTLIVISLVQEIHWLILFIMVTVWYIQVHIYGYTTLIPSPTGLICHYKQLVIIYSDTFDVLYLRLLATVCTVSPWLYPIHYNDVVMSTMASQITILTIAYSIVYSDVDQRKHQSPASMAFVRGIHRSPVNSLHKGPVTQKMFPFNDVIIHCESDALM